MPTLVHLADERDAASIKKNGIKVGKHRPGIYCMPVMQNFYLSHQWLRELKRSGVKTYVGVYFKVDSKTKVYAGRYNKDHRYIELGEAIKEIQSVQDPLGYELILNRKITAKEVSAIKHLPQGIGWRYMPESNGTRPCSCDFCIKRSIKGNRIRQKYNPTRRELSYNEILEKILRSDDNNEIVDLLRMAGNKKRRSDPSALLTLLNRNVPAIDREIADSLRMFRHKKTRAILITLLDRNDDDTRSDAAYSLLDLYGFDLVESLLKVRNEEKLLKEIIEYLNDDE